MNLMKAITMLLIILVLSACTNKMQQYTGQSTYRPVDSNNKMLSVYIEDDGKNNNKLFKKDDVISIKLNRAFICDFAESSKKEKLKRFFNRKSKEPNQDNQDNKLCFNFKKSDKNTRGEIAILADIVELGDGVNIKQGPDAIERAKVVYFDEDVREVGEVLDFSKLPPIYGPTKYNGGSISIKLYVVELDEIENDNVKALLGNLADWGAMFNPGGKEVLDLIKQLSSHLIDVNNKNDLELKYEFTFDANGIQTDSKAPLNVGNYVVLKNHNYHPDNTFDWDKVEFDTGTGLLNDVEESEKKVWKKHTYLTLSIEKGGAPIKNPLQYETLSELEEQFKGEPITELDQSVVAYSQKIAKNTLKSTLSNQIYLLHEKSDDAELIQVSQTFWNVVCKSMNDSSWKSGLNEHDLNDILRLGLKVERWDHHDKKLYTQFAINNEGLCKNVGPWVNYDKIPPLMSK